MRIVGPDSLVFGVDDVAGAVQFCTDAGLKPVGVDATGGYFEALDGTGLEIRSKDDPRLPPALKTGNMIRLTVYGVEDQAALDAIEAEISTDREVQKDATGALYFQDDVGFYLKMQITCRRPLDLSAEKVNAPGAGPQRPINEPGADPEAETPLRSLSHVVYFVPNYARAEKFYAERLGFRVTDRMTDTGPFLTPAASSDHHTLFFINTPDYMQGCEHFAFHMKGPTEVMQMGHRMLDKGYESFWGPGRHWFASNWFWYFNSPMGAKFEFDADMDKTDENWVPREAKFAAENVQLFLLEKAEKWVPGGPPKGAGAPAH